MQNFGLKRYPLSTIWKSWDINHHYGRLEENRKKNSKIKNLVQNRKFMQKSGKILIFWEFHCIKLIPVKKSL